MKLFSLIRSGFHNLYFSIKRFPLAITFSTLTTIILIIITNNSTVFSKDTLNTLERLAMLTALGFPIFLSINLFFERNDDTGIGTRSIIQILGVGLLFLYYFFLFKELNMVTITRYTALTLAFYLAFLFIPYFYKRENFELYVVKIFSRLAVTIIYSVVLYAGLSMTLFTINKLLDIPVSAELYMTTWLIVVGIFAPIFLLAAVPSYDKDLKLKDYPKLFEILLLYIVMPMITVYTTILYIYFIKILVTTEWPQGLVGHLVLWYASISLIVIFFISPLSKRSKWASSFVSWLPKVILPLLIMMFIAIGLRIKTYGVTENRYFVVLLGLWVLGMMLYYILAQKKRNIILLISLAIITILSVFGPWSSYSLSINSQNKRFEDLLFKNKLIENGQIINKGNTIPEKDQKEINAVIRYFDYNHELNDLKSLPKGFSTADMEEIFGFPYTHYSRFKRENYQHFSYSLYDSKELIIIKGYDYLYNISSYYDLKNFTIDNGKISINFDNEKNILTIYWEEKEIYNKSLEENIVKLYQENMMVNKHQLKLEDLTIVNENQDVKFKIIINNISGYIDESAPENIDVSNINFYLFLKIK